MCKLLLVYWGLPRPLIYSVELWYFSFCSIYSELVLIFVLQAMPDCDGNGYCVDFFVLRFFTAQLAGEARQLGCPKIVLDHVRVYLYI